ncbi:hypothetical protein X975_11107, partial [Stegodyphus mimosarum]
RGATVQSGGVDANSLHPHFPANRRRSHKAGIEPVETRWGAEAVESIVCESQCARILFCGSVFSVLGRGLTPRPSKGITTILSSSTVKFVRLCASDFS